MLFSYRSFIYLFIVNLSFLPLYSFLLFHFLFYQGSSSITPLSFFRGIFLLSTYLLLFTETAYLCKDLLILEFEQKKREQKFSSVFLLAFLMAV